MRYLLTAIACILTLSLWAQDGINYQGAATDANGDELTNQNITLRASVLSASANGNLEWEETHSTTTDQFGLFNVVIGQGTNTTNGATANFDEMDWGSANHFLKIEMDATGGDNYAMIGTTQMMSVPYALYAKSAGIDSTMLANMIGSSGGGGGGCDFNFPDGYNGVPVIHDFINDGSYTVPAGKNLYTNMIAHNTSDDIFINSKKIWNSGNMYSDINIILSEGDIISMGTALNTTKLMFGLLVDKKVQSLSYDFLSSGAYTVPSGKNLYIYRINHNALHIEVNSKAIATGGPTTGDAFYPLHLILKSGDIIDIIDQGSGGFEYMFGYLADENYFAGCGGGGSSGTMSVSTYGDTLTMNGQSIIVPGISIENAVPTFGSVTDIEGNTYQTTTIYGTEWMTEDLRVTKFSNGDPLNQITGINNWQSNTCANIGYIINNSLGNLGIKVWYNYFVIEDSRNICPSGWHVATEQDYIDVFEIFGSMTPVGVGYGFWWENIGPAFKKQDGGWNLAQYPEGQATNESYLSFESFDPTSCTNADNFYAVGDTNHRSWTGTPGGNNGGYWSLLLKAHEDEVYFEDASGDTMLPCRCVKD